MKILKRFLPQSIIVGLFVFFLVFSIITGFIFQIQKINQYKAEIIQINNEIENTKEEINRLEKLCNENDLEEVARNQLGMIKSNEIIYVDSIERDN
ncbi:FtsB family cell division protein [Terrisporobacter sp.]|uniref:FtsB family cell division protein n=1 Tax=Terrisporobacter sp. TaxID=1965305 RepID=UPI0026313C52|nr:septum formation initiator family protein [Terrisporobacter sp.]